MSEDYLPPLLAGVTALLQLSKPPDDRHPGVALPSIAFYLDPTGPEFRQSAEEGHRHFQSTLSDMLDLARSGMLIFAGIADPVTTGLDYVKLPAVMLSDWELDASGTAWPVEGVQRPIYRHVRVFLPAEYEFVRACDGQLEPMPDVAKVESAADVARSSKTGAGPENTYDWGEFQRELSRALWNGELPTRRAIRKHMNDWCNSTWGKAPDESRVRQILNSNFFHKDIPEK